MNLFYKMLEDLNVTFVDFYLHVIYLLKLSRIVMHHHLHHHNSKKIALHFIVSV